MKQQRTIVIVDDCLEDRETYRRYLLKDDTYTYTIFEEDYGENGLELCKLVNPDIILLDFLLPDIDGLEFLNLLQLQSGKSNLPVVMLTGQGNEAIAVQAMKNGAQDYLVKGKTTPESLRLAIHNVIERIHLQSLLEQSEKRFRTSVETMLDCFGIFTSIRNSSDQIIDFAIEYVNTAACADNQMSAAAQMNSSLLELLPVHQQAGLFADYCRVVETGEPLLKEALVYADINQQYLNTALDIRAAKLGDGFVAAWRDITDRKRLEAERDQLLAREQAARAAAEQANRTKDVFLAMVSHELRNPLSAILTYAQLLQTRRLSEDKVSRAYETIERSAKLQAQLINDLLDISRIVSGNFNLTIASVDLASVIEAAIETVHLAAEAKNIQLQFVRNNPPFLVLGDTTRLQQVIWNLLSNGIKFTPENGCIQIDLDRIDSYIQIKVSDTGQGISSEFLPYVFERFRQEGTKKGGLGLGLAIVLHLVQLHGGTVEVESPGSGQGATFTIKLPEASDRHLNQVLSQAIKA